MWSRHDTLAQAAELLSSEVWHLDVWFEQALSDDGEATQPRPGGRRLGMCETKG